MIIKYTVEWWLIMIINSYNFWNVSRKVKNFYFDPI